MSNANHGELAATPPMGWNSWDCFGNSVREDEVLANARFMSEHMLASGWDTVVVDVQWHDPDATGTEYNPLAQLELDEFGRPEPAEKRFPSAAGGKGFGPLAQQVHDLGLKFGLHIMRGIPRLAVERASQVAGTTITAADIADQRSTCDWNSDNYGIDHTHPESQRYYDSLIDKFAGWGVDFVKVDDMVGPYHADEVASFSHAVRNSSRPMVLSLSPGRSLSFTHAPHLQQHAEMWRVSADLWDRWSDVADQFHRLAQWAPWSHSGSWPDADMIPLGHIGIRAEEGPDRSSRLTRAEQRTLMTLWCFARSPLMVGADLPTSDAETIELLTDRGLLEVHRFGVDQGQVLREHDIVVWAANDSRGDRRHVAVFNLSDESTEYRLPLSSLGLEEEDVQGAAVDVQVDPVWGPQVCGRLGAHASTSIHAAQRDHR